MNEFSIYLTCIAPGLYNLFVKNISSDADFIKIMTGLMEAKAHSKVGEIERSWVISPLSSKDDAVFLKHITPEDLKGKRIWVAIEAMKRAKPKSMSLGVYMALSPSSSNFPKTIGAISNFDIRKLDTIARLDDIRAGSIEA